MQYSRVQLPPMLCWYYSKYPNASQKRKRSICCITCRSCSCVVLYRRFKVGMGLSDLVSEILGVPEPSARFLMALYSGECVHDPVEYHRQGGTRGR